MSSVRKESETDLDLSREMESESTVLSEQDKKLLRAWHGLSDQPEIESTDDLVNFLRKCDLSSKKKRPEDPGTSTTDRSHTSDDTGRVHDRISVPTVMATYQFPRISSFGGDSNKGEATWECFSYEVEALMEEAVYTPEQILHGIRKAAKGEVSEIIRRLGPGVNIHDVMQKLYCTYGSIDTRETIMKKFYGCAQKTGETVTGYAARLEDFFDKAVTLGGLNRRDTHILKGVLFQGLRREIKQAATYKCDTVTDYDKFKIELRKIEAEMKEERVGEERSKPCRPAVNVQSKEKEEKSEMSEVKDLLKSLNDRIKQLEESQRPGAAQEGYNISGGARGGFRGGRGRGNYGGYGNTGRGSSRGGHFSGRPIAGTTFAPTCWKCHKKGHVIANCPN